MLLCNPSNKTPQPAETSPPMLTLASQNTHNHKKQHITRPLPAAKNTGPPPLLPRATISRPQHMASSKQWPALLPTPVCSRSPTIPNYLCCHPCLTISQIQLTMEQSPRYLTIHCYTFQSSY